MWIYLNLTMWPDLGTQNGIKQTSCHQEIHMWNWDKEINWDEIKGHFQAEKNIYNSIIVWNYIIGGLLPLYCISVELEVRMCMPCPGDGSHSRMRGLERDKRKNEQWSDHEPHLWPQGSNQLYPVCAGSRWKEYHYWIICFLFY